MVLIDFGPFWNCPFYCVKLLRWSLYQLCWRLERFLGKSVVKTGFLVRGPKWPKIDPKPWTIVHGFHRFWAILKLSILLRKITQMIIKLLRGVLYWQTKAWDQLLGHLNYSAPLLRRMFFVLLASYFHRINIGILQLPYFWTLDPDQPKAAQLPLFHAHLKLRPKLKDFERVKFRPKSTQNHGL